MNDYKTGWQHSIHLWSSANTDLPHQRLYQVLRHHPRHRSPRLHHRRQVPLHLLAEKPSRIQRRILDLLLKRLGLRLHLRHAACSGVDAGKRFSGHLDLFRKKSESGFSNRVQKRSGKQRPQNVQHLSSRRHFAENQSLQMENISGKCYSPSTVQNNLAFFEGFKFSFGYCIEHHSSRYVGTRFSASHSEKAIESWKSERISGLFAIILLHLDQAILTVMLAASSKVVGDRNLRKVLAKEWMVFYDRVLH